MNNVKAFICASDSGLDVRVKNAWVVRRWSKYKLGDAEFGDAEFKRDFDAVFENEGAALEYERTAPTGLGSDTRYRYEIIPPQESE